MKSYKRPDFRPEVRATLLNPVHFLATGCGSGLSPRAPGTAGSVAALLVYALLLSHFSLWVQIGIIVIGSLAGIYLCGKTARDWNTPDHGAIVWDEWVAQWIAVAGLAWTDFGGLLLGLAYFRLFDIWKPWPISWCDRHVHGGLGIMLDDILAGLMALAATRGTLHLAGLIQS